MYQDTVLAGVPATSVAAVANGGPPTRSGALFAVAVGAEAECCERGRVRTRDRQIGAVAAMQRDRAAVDGRWIRSARDRIDLREQRLDAVGDVDLVAGRARGYEGDRGAVDGDGVVCREIGGERIRSRAAPDSSVAPVIGADLLCWLRRFRRSSPTD